MFRFECVIYIFGLIRKNFSSKIISFFLIFSFRICTRFHAFNLLSAASSADENWFQFNFLLTFGNKKSVTSSASRRGKPQKIDKKEGHLMSNQDNRWPINLIVCMFKELVVRRDMWQMAFSWSRMIRRHCLFSLFTEHFAQQMVVHLLELTVIRSF